MENTDFRIFYLTQQSCDTLAEAEFIRSSGIRAISGVTVKWVPGWRWQPLSLYGEISKAFPTATAAYDDACRFMGLEGRS